MGLTSPLGHLFASLVGPEDRGERLRCRLSPASVPRPAACPSNAGSLATTFPNPAARLPCPPDGLPVAPPRPRTASPSVPCLLVSLPAPPGRSLQALRS